MNRVQEAFLLVQSLNRGERKRVSSYIDTNSTYGKLFQKLKQPDLAVSDLNWKTTYDKNDNARILLRKIAESMHSFGYATPSRRNSRKKKAIIQWYIMDAHFFYERSIFRLCKKRLLQAEEEAKKIYAYSQLLTIYTIFLNFKIRTIGQEVSRDIDDKKIVDKIEHCLSALKEYTRINDLYLQLFDVVRKQLHLTDTLSLQTDFEELLKVAPQSELAKQRYYQAKAIYYRLLNDSKQALLFNKLAKEWWEQPANCYYQSEEQYQYLLTLNNNAQSFIALLAGSPDIPIVLKASYHEQLAETLKFLDDNYANLNNQEEIKIKAAFLKNRVNQVLLQKQSAAMKSFFDAHIANGNAYLFKQFSSKDKIVLRCQYASICFQIKAYATAYQQIISCYDSAQESTNIRKDLVQELFLLEAIIFIIAQEKSDKKVLSLFKEKCPITKKIALLNHKEERESYLIRALKYLLTFQNCLPNERKSTFKIFAEHICQHLDQPFALDIYQWLKVYPLSSALSCVRNVSIR